MKPDHYTVLGLVTQRCGWKSIAFVTLALSLSLVASAGWKYDWSTRTDPNGMPAGVFAKTPFPIYQTNTSYTITNDENPNGKTFYLGHLYFLDGAAATEGDGSWAHPWKTITNALTQCPSGNVTLVVRGAHGSFDGIYTNGWAPASLCAKPGVDDTHRWMMVGYGQERPVLDGTGTEGALWGGIELPPPSGSTRPENAFATLQRFRIQDAEGGALNIGHGSELPVRDSYFDLIDVAAYGICTNLADKAIFHPVFYYQGAQDGWIYHCTAKRTLMHAFKMGDSASGMICEWNVAAEAGWWDGITNQYAFTNYYNQVGERPYLFDFPNDTKGNDTIGWTNTIGSNNVVRYCIGWDGLAGGIQLRNQQNTRCYDNEIYGCPHTTPTNITGVYIPTFNLQPQGQIWVGNNSAVGPTSNVWIYANYVHDGTDNEEESENCGIGVASYISPDSPVYILNNLLVNAGLVGIRFHWSGTGNSNRLFYVCNNTVYGTSNYPAIYCASGTWHAGEIKMFNNILCSTGTSRLLDVASALVPTSDYDYNLYYYPNGSLGAAAGADDVAAGASTLPQFVHESVIDFSVSSGSPAEGAGTNLSRIFSDDFNGALRPDSGPWNIGCFQVDLRPAPPSNLKVK